MRIQQLFPVLIFTGCKDSKNSSPPPEPFSQCQQPTESAFDQEELVRACEAYAPTRETDAKVVELYFVRHAESEWNDSKNGYNPFKKIHMGLNTLRHDGNRKMKYRDAVLSSDGVKESTNLATFIAIEDKARYIEDIFRSRSNKAGVFASKKKQAEAERVRTQEIEAAKKELETAKVQLKFLREFTTANDPSVALATSNLRRAALTLLIAFMDRIKRTEIDQVFVLSALQEISYMPDSSSLAEIGHRPYLSPSTAGCPFDTKTLTNLFNPDCNLGDQQEKPVEEFCNWIRFQAMHNDKSKFIIVGHSSWLFDFYFQNLSGTKNNVETDLTTANAKGKKQKLGNAGVIYSKITLPQDGGCQIQAGTTLRLTPHVPIKVSGE